MTKKDFSNEKEANISARDISSSEDSGTQTHMPYEFDEGVNMLGELNKDPNLQAMKINAKCDLIFKD